MATTDPRVDAYIEQSAEFAQPILVSLRRLIHATCPEVTETIRWGFPHFDYQGMLCSMAAFKRHCAFGFWKGELVTGGESSDEAMGDLGRIAALDDLPSERKLKALIRRAMKLNEDGVKAPRGRKKPEVKVPDDFRQALAKNARARKAFDGFPPSHRREYIEWITEARTDATRQRRMNTALEWLAEGKDRNWKYRKQGTRNRET